MMKRWMVSVLVVVLVAGGVLLRQFDRFNERAATLPLPEQNVAGLADGLYPGHYTLDPFVSVELIVSIRSDKVTGIELVKHDHGRGGAAEQVLDRVMEANRLPVDVVAGATASSKALMYAVADALEKTDEE